MNVGNRKAHDGSVERADVDGNHLTAIIPLGGKVTPKRLRPYKQHGALYSSDREGMRVMRSNLDGLDTETLLETGTGSIESGSRAYRWTDGELTRCGLA